MANEYVNKVVVNNRTRLDLTGDTVSEAVLLAGFTAHDASGNPIVGTYSGATEMTDDEALDYSYEVGFIEPYAESGYTLFTTNDGKIYV